VEASVTAAGIRERNRTELTRQILETARQQLATDGAASLSLRAIARQLGMASSAIYRYVPSREDLLTQLIVTAYDSLGASVERAEAQLPRSDTAGRFRAIGHAIRRWAIDHEHEYALIFGSPVPGYQAPEDTIAPAARVPVLLSQILVDAAARGEVSEFPEVDPQVHQAMQPVLDWFPPGPVPVPTGLVLRGLMAWTYLFGAVSFEIFGHRHNVIAFERAEPNPFFDAELDRLVAFVGLPGE
jgi:AcrR family transcriptional regulator